MASDAAGGIAVEFQAGVVVITLDRPEKLNALTSGMYGEWTAPHPMAAHRAESRALSSRGVASDAREGALAFRERRPANFVDRVSSGLPDVFPDWEDPGFF